ncbi:uncharacterized protein YbjT (DUF2867 family) [Haloactinospora alba]|uniref:Uncharacterized protein YbjT (DUF2867 family) n=1 Tax=Haloactinospora alba TaxID=405555 RepID=A0A543N8Y3_9ACTN|nr:NmrA family NAD(P)-binding protein [Haloactinospora alba]TQN28291.1 uncharacterized protein YbjT (DUF2867 family) [Haloactinospora alba]
MSDTTLAPGTGPWGPGEITVTGATGTVGAAVAAELASLGHRPRLVTRPSSEAAVPAGAQRVPADLGDTGAVRHALRGSRALLLLTPLAPGQGHWQAELVGAAKAAGVERVVKISALGADPSSTVSVHREHGRAERALRASGLSHASLRPNAFMQNALQWRASIARRGTIELPMGGARVSMIDARDIAAVAVHALLEPERVDGEVELTGPEALSYAEIAAHLSDGTGGEVRYVDVDPQVSAANMRAAGVPEWAIEARLGLYGTIRAGEAERVSSEVRRITGREPCRFPEFVARAGAALRSGT